jgi:tRNA modification GTPase
MLTGDTIAAISSAVGASARMIVRTSGADSRAIAARLVDQSDEPVGLARLRLRDLQIPAWIYHFRAPHSYSGEDTIEYHIPGNPLLARILLDELIRLGARLAEPGEFTARAYFNGRIDLSQAEGVAATIAAGSEAELRGARQLLAGELARRLRPALDLLADTLALVEVGIDFSEEDVAFLSADQTSGRLRSIERGLSDLLSHSARLERLHHTPQIVLVGRPNAGKSTLLNALAGHERAVVSPQAGTTRDALSAEIALAKGVVRLIDVAGIEANDNPNDSIAAQMQQRARASLQEADRVILVRDATDARSASALDRRPDLIVRTKADLLTASFGAPGEGSGEGLLISAHTGFNMKELRARLDALAFGSEIGASLAINARHIQLIHEAQASLKRAKECTTESPELIAIELRDALDALGAILGRVTPDDILGRIFSSFCMGK